MGKEGYRPPLQEAVLGGDSLLLWGRRAGLCCRYSEPAGLWGGAAAAGSGGGIGRKLPILWLPELLPETGSS